jgi:1-acyl-sn-glycerol-3-phosphate acyltransferase
LSESAQTPPESAAQVHPLASVLAVFARLISGVNVRWVDCEPSPRQRIYFANHTSHLDAVVLWASLPDDVRPLARPVAAQDYWEKTAARRFFSARVFNAVLINRNPQGSERSLAAAQTVMARMVEALGDHCSLIVFPEGTRGSGEDVAEFKSGIYHLAQRRPDVELVPAFLENLNRILPKGEVLPVPVLSSVRFGPPMRLEAKEPRRQFLERARSAVLRLRPS